MTDARQTARESATSARRKVFTPHPIAIGRVFPETRADRVEFAIIIWSFCVIVGVCLGVFVVAAR